jgi:hypothetical protein
MAAPRASAAEEDLRTLGCRACHLSFASISNPQVTALQRATGSHTDSTTGFNTQTAGDNRDLNQAGISASMTPDSNLVRSAFLPAVSGEAGR